MVLTRRVEVLGCVLSLVLLGGCSESLFGTHHAGHGADGGGGDGVPLFCPAPCIADAAGDVDRSNSHWRYLDDHRDRTWMAMTSVAEVMTGVDPGNHITTCRANRDAPACRALPDALLVSSAGASSNADPAIEFTFTESMPRVVQLNLHAFVASGANQTIRLYRNSREDVLFTGIATAGKDFAQMITLDALTGDRLLVAVAPTGNGTTDVGLHLFVSGTAAGTPSTCQLALQPPLPNSAVVNNACNDSKFIHFLDQGGNPAPFTPSQGPFPELLGNAMDNPGGTYLDGPQQPPLDHSGDITVQLWVKVRSVVSASSPAWLFSDLDLTSGGGLGIAILPGASPMIDVSVCSDPSTPSFVHATTKDPATTSWQFVRAVVTGGKIHVCLNGKDEGSIAAPGKLTTGASPYLAKDGPQTTASNFNGWLDDVRVITGALPCE